MRLFLGDERALQDGLTDVHVRRKKWTQVERRNEGRVVTVRTHNSSLLTRRLCHSVNGNELYLAVGGPSSCNLYFDMYSKRFQRLIGFGERRNERVFTWLYWIISRCVQILQPPVGSYDERSCYGCDSICVTTACSLQSLWD